MRPSGIKLRKRYGKITEAKFARWYGEDVLDTVKVCSGGLMGPVPIIGFPGLAYQGGIESVVAGGSFASFSDMLAEESGGKRQLIRFDKTGVAAPAVGATQHLWGVGSLPSAGAAFAAAGASPTDATTGAHLFSNAASGDTLHLKGGSAYSTVAGSLLLYDLLVGFNINHATASAQNCTATQARYTGVAGTPEYPGGSFLSARVSTVLGATAHNLTLSYTDQDNNAGATTTAIAARVSAAVNTTPLTQPVWTFPLAAGDVGVRQVASCTPSAASSGNSDIILGMPLAIFPTRAANLPEPMEPSFANVRIMDDACLAVAEFMKAATTAATSSLFGVLVSG